MKSFAFPGVGFVLMIMLCASCSNERPSSEIVTDAHDTTQWPASFEFGKLASQEKIALIDIDVRPDGKGLPEGSGTFREGKIIFENQCSRCHGKTGREGPYGKLVKSESTDGKRADRTIGDYWPYATTLFDYINRAMPYDHPGSLTAEQVYSITAFLLTENQLIDSTIVIDANTLPKVIMPAKDLFVTDDRKGGAEVK